jgi:hypothetical protein
MRETDTAFGDETTYLRVPEYTFCSAPTQLHKIVPASSAATLAGPQRHKLRWMALTTTTTLCGVLFTQADGMVRADAPGELLRAGLTAFTPATPVWGAGHSMAAPHRVDLATIHVDASDEDEKPRVLRMAEGERSEGCNLVLRVVADDKKPPALRAVPAVRIPQANARESRRLPAEVAYSSATPGRSETLAP